MNFSDLYPPWRPLLFRLDPERAHRWTFAALEACRPLLPKDGAAPSHPRRVMGLEFPNPVGVAAGLDKDAEHVRALSALGFGFIEVGTITPHPQRGNSRPRLFRLPAREALINRMGFNSQGLEAARRRLAKLRDGGYEGIVGVNIGVNRDTPEDRVAEAFADSLTAVASYASYVTVNLSSPNTPGLRDWQRGERLLRLLEALTRARARQSRPLPVAVKLSPDLEDSALPDLVDILVEAGIDALIATNTTLTRPPETGGDPHAGEGGGLSGRPLAPRALEVARLLLEALDGRRPLIASGGIHDASAALERLDAGAALVQLYTGLIYRGPGLLGEILRGLNTVPGDAA